MASIEAKKKHAEELYDLLVRLKEEVCDYHGYEDGDDYEPWEDSISYFIGSISSIRYLLEKINKDSEVNNG